MRRWWLSAVVICAPLPAVALSCLAPSVERSFAQFSAAAETYVIMHGRVTFDADQLPRALGADRNPPELTQIPARLVGRSLGATGYVLPFDNDVMLEVSCLGPWCGSVKDGEDVLAFIKVSDEGYILSVPPCGGSAFGSPKPAQLRKLLSCVKHGSCPEP